MDSDVTFIDLNIVGNEASNIYKQNPVSNGYHIVSELNVVLQNG